MVPQYQSIMRCIQDNLLGRHINGFPFLKVTPQVVNSHVHLQDALKLQLSETVCVSTDLAAVAIADSENSVQGHLDMQK